MTKPGKWLGCSVAATLVLLALLAWAGGAVNWNQEPPYELTRHWGEKGDGPAQFNDPTGIAVTAEEVFVADARNSRIQVLDKKGHFLRAFGTETLDRPMNLTVADGKLYVPDYFKDVVHVFALSGDYLRAIAAEDGLNSPGGVAVHPDGSLLVADTYGQRIVRLAPNGKILASWNDVGEFSYPTDVAIAPDGGFYVADGYNDRIQQFGPDGQFIRKWGGPFGLNIFGPFKGWFTTVTSVATDPDGAVYVADFYNDRIQKFTAEGSFLTAFGTPARRPGHSEIAVAVDADGTVWTVNFAGNQVEMWRPARLQYPTATAAGNPPFTVQSPSPASRPGPRRSPRSQPPWVAQRRFRRKWSGILCFRMANTQVLKTASPVKGADVFNGKLPFKSHSIGNRTGTHQHPQVLELLKQHLTTAHQRLGVHARGFLLQLLQQGTATCLRLRFQ